MSNLTKPPTDSERADMLIDLNLTERLMVVAHRKKWNHEKLAAALGNGIVVRTLRAWIQTNRIPKEYHRGVVEEFLKKEEAKVKKKGVKG